MSNLKTPTTDEARERGRKGGIASGKARRKKKTILATFETLLAAPVELEGGQQVTREELIAMNLVKTASDPKSRNYVSAVNILFQLMGYNEQTINHHLAGSEVVIYLPDNGRKRTD